ncbi:alpha/beta fold hydrolase [Martelella endophytica]|uniref:Hydrolase n=1 Tax=Martelella endophytica TaxID=1486262 RepID=A0A0D5LQD7_MAREN|nr:alpha/beta hydrolase [Martelella endophytica]AJY45553.1 hydrolase [Martelella endophytica]
MTNRIRKSIAAAAAGAAITGAAIASSSTASAQEQVKNIVLVHGAFADGSGWRGVYEDLTQRGYKVSIVQNPLTSLADDVAATNRVLDRQDGPTILVGHSWGGTVITEAGVHPNVTGLVYVAALSPDAGESTGQQYEGFPAATEFVLDIQDDGFGFVKSENFKAGFAGDTTEADAAFMRDSQVPINMSVFETKLENAAWRIKPSWAIYGLQDKAFGEGMLPAMAERIGADITTVDASHSIFMTQPQAVAEVIDRAANGVRN